MKIKTIDVQAKEWFDKVNGNSYFGGIVTVNYGMPDAKQLNMPFQYGYGEQFVSEATNVLLENGLILIDNRTSLWSYCDENKIILRTSKHTNQRKRDVIRYGHE